MLTYPFLVGDGGEDTLIYVSLFPYFFFNRLKIALSEKLE